MVLAQQKKFIIDYWIDEKGGFKRHQNAIKYNKWSRFCLLLLEKVMAKKKCPFAFPKTLT